MDPQLTTQAGEAIRRRPSISPDKKYERCMNIVPCEDGSSCTFAHSKEELHHWFQSRAEEEPRLHPTKGARPPYQMCKVAESSGYCPHDVHCNFPHSKEEIEAWKSTIQEREEVSIRPRPEIHPFAHYDICKNAAPCPNGLKCTFAHSEKELHVWFQTRVREEPRKQPPKGARPPFQKCKNVEDTGYCQFDVHCKFWHSEEELKAWESIIQESTEVSIRPRPIIPPLVRYELCMNKPPCPHGTGCTFAHSKEELCYWFQSRVMEEPRQEHPAGVAPEYKMCANVEKSGYCQHDVHCHFPHSKEELDAWQKVEHRPRTTLDKYMPQLANEDYTPVNIAEHRTQSQHAEGVLLSQLSREWPRLKNMPEGEKVPIRSRPEIEPSACYDICKNRAPCPNGMECTFAHSEEELHRWFQSRVEEEPRLHPTKGARPPYQMCKVAESNGYCPHDVHCNFAHSKEEIEAWKSTIQEREEVSIRPRPEIPPLAHYDICKNAAPCPKGLKCTFAHSEEELHVWFQTRVREEPRKQPPKGAWPPFQKCKNVEDTGYCQFDVHCKFWHSEEELKAWERYVQEYEEVPIRPRPEINPLVPYEMCKNKEDCLYGLDCTSAHSEEELCHWIQSRVKDKPRQDPPAWVKPDYRMCGNVEERGYCPSDVHCHCPHSKNELDAWLAHRPPASVHDNVLEAAEWQLAYKESLDKHGSVEVDVKRCMFVGTPSVGKSTLKHLLVHNKPKDIKRSTAVMETPEVVTEHYAVGEFTSEWQLATDDIMESSIRESIETKQYNSENALPEVHQPEEEETAHMHTSNMTRALEDTQAVERTSMRKVASADCQTLERMSTKNEAVALLEKHLPNLAGQQGESIKLQDASFIHLLDTGGQPSFQDALPLLLNAPCTYIQVFNAARDLDQPFPITYRPSDEEDEQVQEAQQLSSETAWDMMLRSFSSMQTMAHKCSKKMPIFQQKGSHLPKLRIFVVGNFRDYLVKEGREMKVVEDICKRLKKLEGKPYYHSIQVNSEGQPFYLINSMAENEDDRAYVQSLRKDISKAEFSLQLKVPVTWFLCMQTTRRCPQKFLRFQDLHKFCLNNGFVDTEKQFSALLHLFFFLGFYSFFNLRGVPNESNFVCTDTGVFLKEVSKLLAIQHHKQPRCSGVRKFQQYGIISSEDDELFEELGIRKEVDRKWFLGALEHLGLLARYSDSGYSAPSYFMPIALPQEKMKMEDQGTVASLCVTFEFPAATPPLVDTDLPRGIFCQLAVKLSKVGSWKPFPKASNRNTVKFRSGKFDVYLREAPGFISLTPFLMEELDGKDPIAELHELCREMRHLFSKGLESAAEDVLGVQGRQAPNLVFGFKCCCDCTQTPHLATPRQAASKGKSLICQITEEGRDSIQEEQIWFSQVDAMLVKLHNIWIMERPFDSTRFAVPPPGGAAGRQVTSIQDVTHASDVIEALGQKLDSKWRHFGTFLCFGPSLMDTIQSDNSRSVTNCMLDLVTKWVDCYEGSGDLPRTWQTIVKAVKKLGERKIAEELAKKYGESTVPPPAPPTGTKTGSVGQPQLGTVLSTSETAKSSVSSLERPPANEAIPSTKRRDIEEGTTPKATVGAPVGPETDEHEYKKLIVPVFRTKPPRPCTETRDVLDIVAHHKNEINAMLNHPAGGTVHFGIQDEGNIVEEGLDIDQDEAMDALEALVGQIVQNFFPAVGASFWSVKPVNLLDSNGRQTGRWRFDICLKPHAHTIVFLGRNDTKAYYRQGACSHLMPADMLMERIKAAVTRSSSVSASPVVKDIL